MAHGDISCNILIRKRQISDKFHIFAIFLSTDTHISSCFMFHRLTHSQVFQFFLWFSLAQISDKDWNFPIISSCLSFNNDRWMMGINWAMALWNHTDCLQISDFLRVLFALTWIDKLFFCFNMRWWKFFNLIIDVFGWLWNETVCVGATLLGGREESEQKKTLFFFFNFR